MSSYKMVLIGLCYFLVLTDSRLSLDDATPDERAKAKSKLEKLDMNKDGVLNETDVEIYEELHQNESTSDVDWTFESYKNIFQYDDTNDDGKVTFDEILRVIQHEYFVEEYYDYNYKEDKGVSGEDVEEIKEDKSEEDKDMENEDKAEYEE